MLILCSVGVTTWVVEVVHGLCVGAVVRSEWPQIGLKFSIERCR
jgi:hypothetical protein